MHGKQKSSKTFIDKDGKLQEVSHTYYNYFTSYDDNSKKMGLANESIPCAVFNGNAAPSVANKELGVDLKKNSGLK
jgi:hypothetical protein